MPSCHQKNKSCKRSEKKKTLNTYRDVVKDYISDSRNENRKQFLFYANQPSFKLALKNAAFALTTQNKRHSHQYRITKVALEKSYDILSQRNLSKYLTFEELFKTIESSLTPIKGIGPLTIYDTTLRIGAYLNLEPKKIYLHAGTLIGAKHLGVSNPQKSLFKYELPVEFHILSESEIEDCLCIYKENLKDIANHAIKN